MYWKVGVVLGDEGDFGAVHHVQGTCHGARGQRRVVTNLIPVGFLLVCVYNVIGGLVYSLQDPQYPLILTSHAWL